jgi:hypothetical protein
MWVKASLAKTMGLSGWLGSVTIIGIRVSSTAAKKMSSRPANPARPMCGWRPSGLGGGTSGVADAGGTALSRMLIGRLNAEARQLMRASTKA